MLGSGSPPSNAVTSSNVWHDVGLMLHRRYHFFLSPPLKYSSLDGGKSPPIFDVVEHDPCYVDRLRLDSWWTYTSCLATSILHETYDDASSSGFGPEPERHLPDARSCILSAVNPLPYSLCCLSKLPSGSRRLWPASLVLLFDL